MKELWYGGTIYTMDGEGDTVEALLLENGKILKTGQYGTLRAEANQEIDLQGSVLYPGFVDSHLHLLGLGEKLRTLDFTGMTSKEEMLEAIAARAKTMDGEDWLIGVGWDDNQFANQAIPTLAELDAIYDGPIFLKRVCRHVALVNAKGLALAGIDNATPAPSTGRIGRNADGNLNGLLYDEAMDIVTDTFPKTGEKYVRMLTQDMDNAVNALLAAGITGAHTEDMSYFGSYQNPLTAFYETIGKAQNFRAHLLRHHKVFEEMMTDQVTYMEGFIEPGAMKIFIDGALGGSTAALSQAYSDEPDNTGLLLYSDEELEAHVKLARKYDQAIAAHVIGDAAVEQILQFFEKYPVADGKRDRLIHASILRPDLIERLKALDVVIDAQPCFIASDFPWLFDRIGKDRAELAYPWQSLLDAGVPFGFGTDAPIENISPFENIYAAIMRKSPHDDSDGYIAAEKITCYEAVRAYTVGSAQAICREDSRGQIKPGFDADFTILDRDLFKISADEILDSEVVKTVVAGRVVYEN